MTDTTITNATVYELSKSLPNKLLNVDGSITDFQGNIISPASEINVEVYKNSKAIANKFLTESGDTKTYAEISLNIFIVVDTLPEDGEKNRIYLVPGQNGMFDEYFWNENGKWDKIGEVNIDLSNYTTTEEVEQIIKSKGYLTEESDPTVPEHVKGITEGNINSWNSKVDEESDPTVPQHVKNIKESDINNWNNKVEPETLNTRVRMFHASIDNSSFQYIKGSADFTYADVANVENCILEVSIANEKMYLTKQEHKNINPPDPIAGRYVGFSNMIRTAGEFAELFLFVYDPENLPTDEESLKRLETWGDYQYCQSSYQPVMMGNFLGKNVATDRNRDNLAPSLKAVGDYTDAQCGVVLDYMQTTFATNIMTLVANAYTKKPVVIYDDPTGFAASNNKIGDTWHLTGLDLSPYKRIKCYVRSGGDSNANYSPTHIVEVHLDNRAKGSFGYFNGTHVGIDPDNRNRFHAVEFIVNPEKTAVQFLHSVSIYGTAVTNSADGRTCYLIEGYYD